MGTGLDQCLDGRVMTQLGGHRDRLGVLAQQSHQVIPGLSQHGLGPMLEPERREGQLLELDRDQVDRGDMHEVDPAAAPASLGGGDPQGRVTAEVLDADHDLLRRHQSLHGVTSRVRSGQVDLVHARPAGSPA